LNSTKIELQKKYIDERRIDCPICNKWIYELAEEMKHPQRSLSFLYCCSSGELLNEENPPFISPDLIVFGFNYVEKNIKRNQGSFICPFTENNFKKNQFRKVFI
jgi:macrophage erythroblast attacher